MTDARPGKRTKCVNNFTSAIDSAHAQAARIVEEAQVEAACIEKEARAKRHEVTKQAEHDLNKLKEQLACYRIGVEALKQNELDELRELHVDGLRKIRQAELMLRARESLSNHKPDVVCPISHCVMRNPVIAADNFSYENSEIIKWILKKGDGPNSPYTGCIYIYT